MADKPPTRNQLLQRWRAIEQDEEEADADAEAESDDVDSSSFDRLRQLKEHWFADAYNFLICLPKDNHIWCGCWEIMGPFLETFYNYFKVESCDSPLKVLWERTCHEMRQCTQCISRHHRAQEMYSTDYDSSVVSPLLSILQLLDEERVSQHLKEFNVQIEKGNYDPEHDSAEVISLMFEVLTFPVLLDDKLVAIDFQTFIEAVDNVHELTLAKQQHFPGVYALLFLNSRRTRSIGLRLAGNMEKVRYGVDLEPLQPLLKKYIGFLANEVIPTDPTQSTSEYARPRLELDRMTAWIGIKALLGFLEPAALEEGILEKYPVFHNFILDHISDDSPEFSHAVNCMRQLFEILGYKLWWRTSLPPSVICDSLLSQCFHTRSEKIHKDIFDLFYPFLVSLEALQDGELEKQRRHFLYFLLHQVTRSSNFSGLMRDKARQISLRIVHRGYKMNPPCPPSECAHMWGPSLVSSIKDTRLHNSLRQPALDLIETIIVSEAAALISSAMHSQVGNSDKQSEEYDDPFSCDLVGSDKDSSCWDEFSIQCNAIYQEYTEWLCVPMIWFDVLVEIDPSVLPVSFSKALVWALSRFSLLEPENAEMSLPIKSWLATKAMEVSIYFNWRCPSGSDDGGDCKECKNSVRVSTMCFALIRTFKRLAAHFTVKMEVGEVWKHWTWEVRMAESLILLQADPNDNVRQFGRRTLESISKTRGLACGLRFLCSSEGSLSATLLGLRHALQLVRLDPVLMNYQALHHFFFVLYKVLREGFSSAENLPGHLSNEVNMKLSSQGGFLQQPTFSSLSVPDDGLAKVLKSSWEKFSHELAKAAWPSVQKCLQKGKEFIDYKISQMTCVRVLEIVPVVLENLITSPSGQCGIYGKMTVYMSDFSWLHDLVFWGKSSLQIIVRYWKQSFISILGILKASLDDNSSGIILAMENNISCDAVSVELLVQQVLQLSISFSTTQSHTADKSRQRSRDTHSENLAIGGAPFDSEPLSEVGMGKENLEFEKESKNNLDNLVVLSDDDSGSHSESDGDILAVRVIKRSQSNLVEGNSFKDRAPSTLESHMDRAATGQTSQAQLDGKTSPFVGSLRNSSETPSKKVGDTRAETLISKPVESSATRDVQAPASLVKPSTVDNKKKELKKSKSRIETIKTKNSDNVSHVPPPRNDAILKAVVHNSEDDPLEQALKSVRKTSILIKQSSLVPKRQVIQLGMPVESRPGYMQRQELVARRFKQPRLEEWFRRILELDYFSTVGLSSENEDEYKDSSELKEVPVTFDSFEQYVDIFRPLVLEEFKAQLRSSFQESSGLEQMSCGSLSVVSVEKVDDFNLVRCIHDEIDVSASSYCSENDLILLTKQPLQKSPHNVHLLGKVERREKDNKRRSNILVIRVYLQGGCSRLNRARKFLLERSKWFLSRIMSITSQLREFQALTSISTIPALPVILRPAKQSHHHEPRSSDLGKLPQAMQRVLQSTFNDSQLQAIGSVLKSSDSEYSVDLSLVQGPPGTGKTRTIVAIISAFLAMHSPCSTFAESQLSRKMKPDTNSRTRISNSAAIARAWQDAALARQLINEVEKDNKSTKALTRKRVLVCAQSNAAVDELVSRLAGEGIYGADGQMHRPYIVRIGNAKTVHPNSLPFFIDTLVENRLNEEKMKTNDGKNIMGGESSAMIRSCLEKVVDRIRFYESKRANLKEVGLEMKHVKANEISETNDANELSDADLGAKLRSLYEQRKEIYKKLAGAQAEEKRSNEEIRALRTKLRRSILREAEIVVATLSGCGGDLFSICSESASNSRMAYTFEQNLFDAVVVDEAAQALEPATLIPLQLLKSSGTKCIMVGDPKQLPATVLSTVACKYSYECSMFERLQRAGRPVIMLTKQYRMHPEISHFPSVHFYDGKLLNGIQLSSKMAPFHETESLGPYVFYDVVDGQEMHGKYGASSLCNEGEANAAVEILKFFKNRYPSEFTGGRIGIITPYKSQLSLLRSRFSNAFGSSVTSDMEFNTVDGFQGREVDILLLSTVRSSASSVTVRHNYRSIGFVADVRRMNVALTRARLSLWILGNSRTLKSNNDWAALLKDASERNLVVPTKYPYKSLLKTPSGPFPESLGNPYSKAIFDKGERIQHVIQNESSSQQTHKVKSGCTQAPTKKRRHEVDIRKKERRVDTGDEGKGKDNSAKKISLEGRFNELTLKSANIKNAKGERSRQMDNHETQVSNFCQQSSADPRVPPQHSKRQKSRHKSTSPDKGESLCKDADQKERLLSETDSSKTLISKRKQQRDAVDALLSSALISSKKSETSSKSMPHRKPSSLSSADNNLKIKKTKRS